MESSSSSSGSSRRNTVTQVVSCLVDGCNSDLSQCREYHRRHKVCELHSKTPKVTVGGREQRFCQQCSRFHSLEEFDDGKRSCRKRLDGHNRRRRKPRSESLPRNPGGLLTNQQGAVLLSFASPQTFPSAAAGSASAWAEAVRSRDDAAMYANCVDAHNFHESLAQSYRRENQFQILQATYTSHPEVSVFQLPYPNSASEGSGSCQKMLSNVSSEAIHSDCALSLLSSVQAETPEFGLRQLSLVQPHGIPSGQSIVQSNCLYSQGVERMHAASSLDSNGGSNADIHCQGTFLDRPDASSVHQQTLSFMWH